MSDETIGDVEVAIEKVVDLLRQCPYIRVHARTDDPGLRAPKYLIEKGPSVAFDIGLNANPPIPDLSVDAEGISGTLSFGGKPFRVVMPWSAIVLVHPPHIAVPTVDTPKPRHLKAVPKDAKFDAQLQDSKLIPDKNPRVPPKLRLIKGGLA